MIRLRRAVVSDVEGIGNVVREVWGQEILPDVCRAQIEDVECELWVAEGEDDILGFISAFLTVNKDGHRRWEMDLVAVRPSQQGRGLGQRLIRRACEGAVRVDAAVARALIRLSNVASQKAFQRTGFTTDRRIYHLLLWSPTPIDGPAPRPRGASLTPVDTLTYRGLWIEGLEQMTPSKQHLVVNAARSTVAREKRLNAGALIPADKVHLLTADPRAQAKLHGRYYWFAKRGSVGARHRA